MPTSHILARSHRLLCALGLLGLVAAQAQAQVVRCTDAKTGRVTYTNGACISGERSVEVQPPQTPTEIANDRAQAAAATARNREQMAFYQAERDRREDRERREAEAWQREQARIRASQPVVVAPNPSAQGVDYGYYGTAPYYYGTRPHYGNLRPGAGFAVPVPSNQAQPAPPARQSTMVRGQSSASAPANRSMGSSAAQGSRDR